MNKGPRCSAKDQDARHSRHVRPAFSSLFFWNDPPIVWTLATSASAEDAALLHITFTRHGASA